MTPRDNDQGSFDDTEVPDGREHRSDNAEPAGHSGSFADTEQPDGREHRSDDARPAKGNHGHDDRDQRDPSTPAD